MRWALRRMLSQAVPHVGQTPMSLGSGCVSQSVNRIRSSIVDLHGHAVSFDCKSVCGGLGLRPGAVLQFTKSSVAVRPGMGMKLCASLTVAAAVGRPELVLRARTKSCPEAHPEVYECRHPCVG